MDASRATGWLERSVAFLQTLIAGFLVVLLAVGVIDLGLIVGRFFLARDVTNPDATLTLIRSAVDVVLYLFVVVELYKTIVAYVEEQSVVVAVMHAGLIAVVRQIITFKPDEYVPSKAIIIAGVYALLLVALLVGFYVVHGRIEEVE